MLHDVANARVRYSDALSGRGHALIGLGRLAPLLRLSAFYGDITLREQRLLLHHLSMRLQRRYPRLHLLNWLLLEHLLRHHYLFHFLYRLLELAL